MCAQRIEDEENSPEITAESTVVLSSSITLSRIFFINIHIKHGFLHHGSRNPRQIRICYVRVLF